MQIYNSCLLGITIFCIFLVVEAYASAKLFADENGQLMLSTPFKFGGETLDISFPADHGSAIVMAKKFCDERGDKIGIKAESLAELCVKPIGELFIGILDKQLKTKPTSSANHRVATFDISGTQVEIDIDFEAHTPSEIAGQFCRETGRAMQLDEGQCMSALTQQLENLSSQHSQRLQDEAIKKKSLSSPESIIHTLELQITGKEFKVQFRPKMETASSAAKKFCVKNMRDLDIKFSELNTKCISIVEAELKKLKDE